MLTSHNSFTFFPLHSTTSPCQQLPDQAFPLEPADMTAPSHYLNQCWLILSCPFLLMCSPAPCQQQLPDQAFPPELQTWWHQAITWTNVDINLIPSLDFSLNSHQSLLSPATERPGFSVRAIDMITPSHYLNQCWLILSCPFLLMCSPAPCQQQLPDQAFPPELQTWWHQAITWTNVDINLIPSLDFSLNSHQSLLSPATERPGFSVRAIDMITPSHYLNQCWLILSCPFPLMCPPAPCQQQLRDQAFPLEPQTWQSCMLLGCKSSPTIIMG